MINIVVPIYNEDESVLSWLHQVVSYLNADDQLVVVDASDAPVIENFSSQAIFKQERAFYLRSDKGRAVQMNAGAEFLLSKTAAHSAIHSEPSLLWFLHSDSGLSSRHLRYLSQLSPEAKWGRFDVQLSPNIYPFGIISKLINLRSRFSQVMTGDQGIFIRSDIFQQLEGYAAIPLMEDVEISKRLRKLGRADCDGPVLQTSARRWQRHGWLKTVLLMWQLRLMYWLGVSPQKLVKKYYG
jgi:rSAM/selenodomain-associated transferase 2